MNILKNQTLRKGCCVMNPIVLLLALGVGYLGYKETLTKGKNDEQGTCGNDDRSTGHNRPGGSSEAPSKSGGPGRVTPKQPKNEDNENDGNEHSHDIHAVAGEHGDDLHGEQHGAPGRDQGQGVTPTVSLLKE
jgi:hypothetical protein